MAPTEVATLPAADCEHVDIEDPKLEAVELVVFEPKIALSPTTAMDRTLRYASDPEGYLVQALGESKFNELQPKLCIPEEFNKDFYGTGTHKSNFEQHIAKLLGKEHGLFFITGVQAQLAGLIVYCDRVPNYRVGWHVSSHLESAERDAYQHLYKLKRILLGNDPEALPTVDEIKEVVTRTESCRPAAILLEIPNRTLGCSTYTFDELEAISKACRDSNVKLHCDGARLWEIEPYYLATAGKKLTDVCVLFDSVYVSFYKGLASAGGAMLISNDADLIDQAKVWQRRTGGNVFTLFYQIIDSERGFNENIGALEGRWGKMVDIADGVTKATQKFKTKYGLPYIQFWTEKPTCLQVHTIFNGFTADELTAARDKVQDKMNVRVFNKLRAKEIVDMKAKDEKGPKDNQQTEEKKAAASDTTHFIEWLIMETTEKIETKVYVDAYVALCEELGGDC